MAKLLSSYQTMKVAGSGVVVISTLTLPVLSSMLFDPYSSLKPSHSSPVTPVRTIVELPIIGGNLGQISGDQIGSLPLQCLFLRGRVELHAAVLDHATP